MENINNNLEPSSAQAAPKPSSKSTLVGKFRHPSQFSKPQLAVFVLAFAVIGYLLYTAFAAAPLLASLQAEQMTPSGGSSPSNGFMTSLTNNGSATTPYLWTFNPGVATSAGYFFADGKQLAKINGPGPYVLRLNSGMLSRGVHKLGHAWDTTVGTHQTPSLSYSETVNNKSGSGFITTFTNNMTINAPYVWAFDPGTPTSAGYFFADGKQLSKISGPGPYAILLGGVNNNVLTTGAHQLGHAWDTTAGLHDTPASAYAVTYNPGTTAVNSSIVNDSTASGGQATKFGSGVSLSGTVSLPSQSTSLTVMAHGEQCLSSWPQMNVKVDGQSFFNTTVTTTGWTAYNINLTLNSGSHTIAVSNVGTGCANLYTDVINAYGPNVIVNPPTVSLSASPSSISSGQSSTLTWVSTNATACTASGAWSGTKPASGTASTGILSQNSTYTLTCIGSGGSAIASYTVNVSTPVATSYDQAIAYSQTRPAFTPTRTINVSSSPQLLSAISGLQPGDLVKATASFTVPGETVISKRLSAPAVIDLSGYAVSFVYNGGSNLPAVWLNNAQNLRIYGGDMTTNNTGGSGILDYGSQNVLWWGFTIHDTGSTGMGVEPINGPVSNDDFQGTIWSVGHKLSWDPHAEKGSGLHAVLLDDVSNTNAFNNNRFAYYAHDIPVGACIEAGNNVAPTAASGNVLYLKCINETFVSKIQTGGNAIQFWGMTTSLGMDIKYLESDNLQGYALVGDGIYSGQNLKGVTVEYGRATNTNQNSRFAGQNPWDYRWGQTFKDVQPTPVAGQL